MNKKRISLIVAMDEAGGIGKKNELLFKIHEDLKRFKEKTRGHVVIMGRKTYDSILSYNGKPLPGRLNLVLSRDGSRQEKGIVKDLNSPLYFVLNLSIALKLAEEWETTHFPEEEKQEIFIIGGGQIFKEALEKGLVDRLYVTLVKGEYPADAFFPDYSQFGFTKVIEKEEKEGDGYQYAFLELGK